MATEKDRCSFEWSRDGIGTYLSTIHASYHTPYNGREAECFALSSKLTHSGGRRDRYHVDTHGHHSGDMSTATKGEIEWSERMTAAR
jgi:hypothetical protein